MGKGNGDQGGEGQTPTGGEEELPEEPIVAPQLALTDVRRIMSSFFGSGTIGKTDFENRHLNDMVDLVESAKPSDLEAAGDALWDAAREIKKAGNELITHIGTVEWEGESGNAFREWGKKLAQNTLDLGDFAGTAATQIKAAGVGLATVQSSMPPRDNGKGTAIGDVPFPARVDGNPGMADTKTPEGKKREEDRQEAIAQMNKLSSYYQVSYDTMAAQKMPVFEAMPSVGVPQPRPESGRWGNGGSESDTPLAGGAGGNVAAVAPDSSDTPAVRPDAPTPHQPSVTPVAPDNSVSTDIDSAKTLPPPVADHAPTTPTTSPPTTSAPPVTGPVPGVPNAMPPRGAGKTPGISGTPRPVAKSAGPTGRPTGPANPVGRPTGPTGQSPVGRPTGQTPAGRPTGPTGQSPMGRAGTSGAGQPVGRPGSTASPRPAGRSGPVVGGTPSRSGPTAKGPRIPRGTVVGGEQSSTTGRGASGGTGRKLGSGPGGVVGNPRSGASAQGRQFTQGGSGLVRGESGKGQSAGAAPRGKKESGREREREDAERPDYLTEDEETWTNGRRGTVPPVIE
ncbi:WXG100 family type VII secretion target [Streptomyces daliensis]|uniref:Uncharacterized protein n=1 Tax=Streptomyces daliensis TaxID=299421 RepID=A0A8T4IQ79_9ACTN|nr:hypothetical protein [Streptomyces daliensis]